MLSYCCIVLHQCFMGKGAKERSRAAAQGRRPGKGRAGPRQGSKAGSRVREQGKAAAERKQGKAAGQGAGQGSRVGEQGKAARQEIGKCEKNMPFFCEADVNCG